MTAPAADPDESPTSSSVPDGEPVAVLCVDDDPGQCSLLERALGHREAFAVQTFERPGPALAALDRADCVISDYEMPDRDGLELLAAVRERAPTLPFVVRTGREVDAVADDVLAHEWTDVVRKDGSQAALTLLARRVRHLVGHRRERTSARRSLATLDVAWDGLAVVAPDGAVVHANRALAELLDRDRADLVGADWRSLFTDEAADRLAADALPSVDDGWRWTGTCAGRRVDGESVPLQVRIASVEGDALAVSVCESGAAVDET